MTEQGDQWDDPSEDLLFELLGDVERGEQQFFIVERTSDASGQTFIQVVRTDEGAYRLEQRQGGPDNHTWAVASDMRSAHSVMTAWAFDLPGWQEALTWQTLGTTPELLKRRKWFGRAQQ